MLMSSTGTNYVLNGCYQVCLPLPKGEQSHYSNHPRAHTVKLGRMTTWKKFPPTLAIMPNLVLLRLSGHSDPIVHEPFDVTLWCSGVPWTPNLLNISLDIEVDFQHIVHISKLHENAFHAATECSNAWWHPTVGENCAVRRQSMVKVSTSACFPNEPHGPKTCPARGELPLATLSPTPLSATEQTLR